MAKVTYDANICIRYKLRSFPPGFYLSAVVLQELLAGASDAATLKELERLRHGYRKLGRMLVPTDEDWWYAGLTLNALQRGRRDQKRPARYRRYQQQSVTESSTTS